MTEPTQPKDATAPRPPLSRRQLETEIERSRAELAATLDELTTRLSPSYQASRLAQSTRRAASDVGALVTGDGLPADAPHRARNAKLLLGAVAVAVAVVALGVVRAVRR